MAFHVPIIHPWLSQHAISSIEDRFQDCAVMRIEGDMMAPSYKDGDYALIDMTENRFVADDIYALLDTNNIIMVRYVQYWPKSGKPHFRIACANKRYEDRSMSENELKIVGRICATINRR